MPDTFFLNARGEICRRPANPNQNPASVERHATVFSLAADEVAAIKALSSTDPVRLAYEGKALGVSYSPTTGAADIIGKIAFGPVVYPVLKADGVTDETAVLQAVVDGLGVGGGRIVLPAGVIICNNLTITTDHVVLEGQGNNGLITGTSRGTQLKATAGSANSVIICEGPAINNRRYYLGLRGLMLKGPGTPDQPILRLKNVSYARFERVSFDNTSNSWVQAWNCWDSRFWDCEFSWGGSSDGTTAPGVNLKSDSGSDNTNEFYFFGCRFEAFPGTALALTGTNTYSIKVYSCKFEGTSTNAFIANRSSGTGDFIVEGCILTCVATSGSIANGLIDISGNSTRAVKIDATLQVINGAVTVAKYVNVANCNGADLTLRLLSNCPEPLSSGPIVSWDGTGPQAFFCKVTTTLTAKWHGYYFGSPSTPRLTLDDSWTSGAPTDGGTTVIPIFLSGFYFDHGATIAAHTVQLPNVAGGLKGGQTVTIFAKSAITTLTIAASQTVSGAPTTLAAGGGFMLRFITALNRWVCCGKW